MKAKTLAISVVLFFAICLTSPEPADGQTIPNPVLVMSGQAPYEANGKHFIRYSYFVFNDSSFPNAMFAAAPSLPPCGANANSSRTWVDLFDQRGKRLQGFCALGSNSSLNGIWFALEAGEIPPSWIYIEMNDRQTGTKYKSNLAETTM